MARHGISRFLKGRLYNTTIHPLLLYHFEVWPLRVEDVFSLSCLTPTAYFILPVFGGSNAPATLRCTAERLIWSNLLLKKTLTRLSMAWVYTEKSHPALAALLVFSLHGPDLEKRVWRSNNGLAHRSEDTNRMLMTCKAISVWVVRVKRIVSFFLV